MSDEDIDFVCSVCGFGGLLYARPRYCLLCTHYAVSETLAEPEYTQRKSKGIKRIRCDHVQDEHVKQREFNQKKRLIDDEAEYEAFVKSWSLQQ